jgi:hypothetical protein
MTLNSLQENQSVNPIIKKKNRSNKKIEETIKSNPGLMQFEMDHKKDLPELIRADSVIKKSPSKELKIQKKLMKKGMTRDAFIKNEEKEFPA